GRQVEVIGAAPLFVRQGEREEVRVLAWLADLGFARSEEIELRTTGMDRPLPAAVSPAPLYGPEAIVQVEALKGGMDLGHVSNKRFQRCKISNTADDLPDTIDGLISLLDIEPRARLFRTLPVFV